MDEKSHTFGSYLSQNQRNSVVGAVGKNRVSADSTKNEKDDLWSPNKPTPLIYRARPKYEIVRKKHRHHRKPTLEAEVPDFHTPQHPHLPQHHDRHHHHPILHIEEQVITEPRRHSSDFPEVVPHPVPSYVNKAETGKEPDENPKEKAEAAASLLASEIIYGYLNTAVEEKKEPEAVVQELLPEEKSQRVDEGAQTEEDIDGNPVQVPPPEKAEEPEVPIKPAGKQRKAVRISSAVTQRSITLVRGNGGGKDYQIEDVTVQRSGSVDVGKTGLPFPTKSKSSSSLFGGSSLDRNDSIFIPPTIRQSTSAGSTNVSDKGGSEDDGERPDWASDPKEFTKSGLPMPFWYYELKKGTEYIMKLHRRYGHRKKHERVPVHKPDMDIVSLEAKASDEGVETDKDMYHPALIHLVPLDRMFLFHRVIINEGILFCCNKIENDYRILNHHGHFLYRVVEYERFCRKSIFVFVDHEQHEVVRIEPLSMNCEGKRRYAMYCPLTNLIGFIVQLWTGCDPPSFSLFDENGTEIIKFDRIAPRFKERKNPDLLFEYQSVRGTGPLGVITMKLADLKMADFTENDYYGIRVAEILPPNIKVRIMAAWFVIYGIFYRGKTYRDIHHHLTPQAERLYLDKLPSTKELPDKLEGGFGMDDDDEPVDED